MITSERGLEEAFHAVFHAPPLGRITWKLQDAFSSGVPDRIVCLDGRVAWVELKYIRATDIRKKTGDFKSGLRVEQRRRLREWCGAGGAAYVLLGLAASDDAHTPWLYLVRGNLFPSVEEHITRTWLGAVCSASGPLSRDTIRAVVAGRLAP